MFIRNLSTPTVLVLSLVLAACSTPTTRQTPVSADLTAAEKRAQQALHIERVVTYQARLEQIGAPLLKAALPFCKGKETGYLGLRVDNIDAWSEEYHRVARDALQLDHALKVTQVTPESPAAQAGLQVGDLLLSVNGQAALGGPGAVDDFGQMISRAVSSGTSTGVNFVVSRNGTPTPLELQPERMCNYPIHIMMDNSINAFANGHSVVITSGLIRFSENDAEVALVLAHEIAHNSMEHIEAKMHNARAASLFDLVAAAYGVDTGGLFARLGAHSFSKAFESEADYLGLYIMARAGLRLRNLENFWRRMAAEDPSSNKESIFRSHPISAQRTLTLRQAMDEIEAKRRTGQPMLPERKHEENTP